MSRFYFNLRSSKGFLEDSDGQEYESLTAAREAAILSAREIMASRVKSGKNPDDGRFEIMDITGQLILTVPFKDAYTTD
jgi:hypothetical protein